jgi:hypothetical protein
MAETRIRRGKEVTIPEEWRCVVPTHGTYKDRKDARVLVRAARKRKLRVERKFDLDSQLTE